MKIYKLGVFVLGALPATFIFLLGSFYSFVFFNNISSYLVWSVLYFPALIGTLGFWLELFITNKTPRFRILILISMVIGVSITCYMCFFVPRFLEDILLLIVSPVFAAILVLLKNCGYNMSDARTLNAFCHSRILFMGLSERKENAIRGGAIILNALQFCSILYAFSFNGPLSKSGEFAIICLFTITPLITFFVLLKPVREKIT